MASKSKRPLTKTGILKTFHSLTRLECSLDKTEYNVREDTSLLHTVWQLPSGHVGGEVRLIGHVIIDGKHYRYNRTVNVAMKEEKRKK